MLLRVNCLKDIQPVLEGRITCFYVSSQVLAMKV